MKLDYNEFTLTEQELILYAVTSFENKQKELDKKSWMEFLKGGFTGVCKQISKIKF